MARKKSRRVAVKSMAVPMRAAGKAKLDVLDFATAGGKVTGLMVALSTIAGIYGIMGGFPIFNALIADIYRTLGYSVSWLGALLGLIYGFIDGFVFFGLMAWFYNKGCMFRKRR